MSKYLLRLKDNEAQVIANLRGVSVDTFKRGGSLTTYRVDMSAYEFQVISAMRNTGKTKQFKRLFFDIETSPLLVATWRIGYNINLNYANIIEDWKIICISYKFEGGQIHTLTWDNNRDDRDLLLEFTKIAANADEIIGHNVDRFDIKRLRTRCIIQGVPAFPKYRTFDTLKKCRSYFSFNSNSLNNVGETLNLGGKEEHEGLSLWLKCKEGDPTALKKMVKYCERDVELLEQVYLKTQHYVKPNTHVGVREGNKKYSCPICASTVINLIKDDVTRKGTLSRVVQCTECNHVYNISNKVYMEKFKK